MCFYPTLDNAISAVRVAHRIGGKVHGFKRVNGRWSFQVKF